MTSEVKSRKSHPSKETVVRMPMNNVKGSGDAAPAKTPHRSKSKNTIPKSLRYDLENALVGLCDVWFEEIKPYLVQNNIKLHVHSLKEDDCERKKDIEYVNPTCSHLDPASSAPQCGLCRLLFNAANSIESAVSQAANASASCAITGNETLNKVRRKGNSRKNVDRVSATNHISHLAQPRKQVIRDCQMNNISATNSPIPMERSHFTPQKKNKTALKKMSTIRKPQMKDASTQTDKFCKGPKKSNKGLPLKMKAAQLDCCPATTVIVKRNPDVEKKLENNRKLKAESPLFKDDLVDIIGEKHDKMLKVLFRSPDRSDCSSTLYLASPLKSYRKPLRSKNQPWR